MSRILVFITTYNRAAMLSDLLDQISTYKDFARISLVIVNDGTDKSYDCIETKLQKLFPDEHTFIRCQAHYGKEQYWRIINLGFVEIRKRKWDFVIQLPDDIQLVPDFFSNAIRRFYSIEDKYRCCLNLLRDESRTGPMWTPVLPEKITSEVFRTGWVDMCYLANRYFFEMLNWKIDRVPDSWFSSKEKSSGVGYQISTRLVAKGLWFYQVAHSLVIHGDHQSVMHPQLRKTQPLITNHKPADKVILGVASMRSREKSLQEMFLSIIDQVDEFHVYLNDYTRIPQFLKHEKVTAYLGMNHIGDIGDVGKYFSVSRAQGYFISCDDDLIYPRDYVSRLVASIEKYQRKTICTYHGRTFNSGRINSYYHDHKEAFRCLGKVDSDLQIHVGGTGVMGYHTSCLKLSLDDFELSNMADIWLAIRCHKKKVPIMLLSHSAGWIKETRSYNRSYTIYEACHRNDGPQTEVINRVKWPKLTR